MFESVEAYYRPASVPEAVRLLQNGKGRAQIVAGCTDVIASYRPRPGRPVRFLIDITRAGLNYVRVRRRARSLTWAIGAAITMAEIEESAEIRALAGGLLSRAAATCGSVEIRNMATVGGNLANGSPAADLATPLLALDAAVVVATPQGRRKAPLADYLAAARSHETANSLLVEVVFPDPPSGLGCGWSFQKFGRTAMDISVVNVAAGLQLDAYGRVKWVRIALGAVALAPIRMPAAEALMAGRVLDHGLIAEASEAVTREVRPVDDIRAPAVYRRELSRILTGRALEACAASAGWSL